MRWHGEGSFDKKSILSKEEYEKLWVQLEKFEIWKTRDTGKNCLVLKYKCPALVKRHKFLMKEHKATFDFDEFIPHITLSYDINDMTLKDFGKPEEIGNISINKEYGQALDLDWSKKV